MSKHFPVARTAWLIGLATFALATFALAASAHLLQPSSVAGAPPHGRLVPDAPGGAAAPAQGTLTVTAVPTGTVTITPTVGATMTLTAMPTGSGTAVGTGTPPPTISADVALPFASYRRWHEAGNIATGIQVQNLEPAAAANIVAQFFDDSGAMVASVARTAAGGGAPNFYLPTIFRDTPIANGIFSVRVTGNRPLGAIVRTDWFNVRGAGIAANPATGSDVIVASFLRQSHGRSSMVAIQNTSSTTATATIVVYGGTSGNVPQATFPLTLPGHGARRVWADFEAALTPLGSFEGWLRVTGTQSLSVQSWEVGEVSAGAPLPVAAFEGQPASTASDKLAVALFRSAQRGVLDGDRLNTRIAVVNPGIAPVTVTVTFSGSDNDAAASACQGRTFTHPAVTLPPRGRHVFRQAPGSGHTVPADCFGTARISTGSPAHRVVAMVYDATNDDGRIRQLGEAPSTGAAPLRPKLVRRCRCSACPASPARCSSRRW